MSPAKVAEGYRLLTYDDDGRAAAGVLVGGRVYAAADLLDRAAHDTSSLLTLLNDWAATHEGLVQASQTVDPEGGVLLREVTLRAPVLYPRAIFCTGANYWDHIEEMEGKIDRSARPAEPWLFVKTAAHSIIADGAPVRMPPKTKQLDWEAELAVVIGTEARDVVVADAPGVVAGYTILNDLSARDLMTRNDRPASMTYDWVGQKCFDGAAPMGPWLTPAAFVKDCHNLSVRLWVNGGIKQDSNTNQLVHNVYELIEWLSHQLTLLPGDVIATGTPSGVGLPRGEFLKTGDVMRIEIDGCGTLTNAVV